MENEGWKEVYSWRFRKGMYVGTPVLLRPRVMIPGHPRVGDKGSLHTRHSCVAEALSLSQDSTFTREISVLYLSSILVMIYHYFTLSDRSRV